MPPAAVTTVVAYTSYIISWFFVLILLFRVFICVQRRNIIIPSEYVDGFYTAGKITVTVFCLAVLLTFISAYTPFGGMFGIPLGVVLLPIALTSMVIALHCEVPVIRTFIRGSSKK